MGETTSKYPRNFYHTYVIFVRLRPRSYARPKWNEPTNSRKACQSETPATPWYVNITAADCIRYPFRFRAAAGTSAPPVDAFVGLPALPLSRAASHHLAHASLSRTVAETEPPGLSE